MMKQYGALRNRRQHPFVIAVAALLFSGALQAQEPADAKTSPATTLGELVAQLLALKEDAVAEQKVVDETAAHLARQLDLLSREQADLETRIAEAETKMKEESSERERLAREITEKERILLALAREVRAGEDAAATARRALPLPLRKQLAQTAAPESPTGDNAADRLNRALLMANDLGRIQSTIHLMKETLDIPERGRVEADVLYFGSAIGYYVAPDDAYAGLRLHRGDEWVCVPHNDAAKSIRKAIRLAQKDEPAALVELPIETGGAK